MKKPVPITNRRHRLSQLSVLLAGCLLVFSAHATELEIGGGYGIDTSPDLRSLQVSLVFEDVRISYHRWQGPEYVDANAASIDYRFRWRDPSRDYVPVTDIGLTYFDARINERNVFEYEWQARDWETETCFVNYCYGNSVWVETGGKPLVDSDVTFRVFVGMRFFRQVDVGYAHYSAASIPDINTGINQLEARWVVPLSSK